MSDDCSESGFVTLHRSSSVGSTVESADILYETPVATHTAINETVTDRYPPWFNLPQLFMEALSLLLDSKDLQSARLVCRFWAEELASVIKDIELWPARFATPHPSSLPHIFTPKKLLAGINSQADVHILISDMASPAPSQTSALMTMLSTSPVTTLEFCFATEASNCNAPSPATGIAASAHSFLGSIKQHTKLCSRLKGMEVRADVPICLPAVLPAARACMQLQTLLLWEPVADISAQDIQQLASITTLQQLRLPNSSHIVSNTNNSVTSMQHILHTLSALRELRDLWISIPEINSGPQLPDAAAKAPPAAPKPSASADPAAECIKVPEWPKLKTLVQIDAKGSSITHRLGPHLASTIELLCLPNIHLPLGCTAMGKLCGLVVPQGQDISLLPAMPEVRVLVVHANAKAGQLLSLLRGMPKLEKLELEMQLKPSTSHRSPLDDLTTCLADLGQLLQQLPDLAPCITSLTLPTKWQDVPEDQDYALLDATGRQLRGIMRSLSKLTALKALCVPVSFAGQYPLRLHSACHLSHLTNLQHLSGGFFFLDVSKLPASVTKLEAMGLLAATDTTRAEPSKMTSSLERLEQLVLQEEATEEQQQQPSAALAHKYPALKHVSLVFMPDGDLQEDDDALSDNRCLSSRMRTMSIMQPALETVEEMIYAESTLVCSPACLPPAVANLAGGLAEQHYNCNVLSRCTALRSLCIREPWSGMQQHLACLTRLTHLSIVKDMQHSEARLQLSEEQLQDAVEAVMQLTQLRHLEMFSEVDWPDGMAQQLKQALPGCRLQLQNL